MATNPIDGHGSFAHGPFKAINQTSLLVNGLKAISDHHTLDYEVCLENMSI